MLGIIQYYNTCSLTSVKCCFIVDLVLLSPMTSDSAHYEFIFKINFALIEVL